MTITAEHEPTQADNVQALIAEEITWAESETWRPQPDRLTAQIEIYEENVILRLHKEDRVVTRRIHPKDLADLFAGDIVFTTGLLPDDTLWHVRSHAKRITALWREPRVWPVALQYKPFEDPRRLMLPMPGLVFLCTPSTPPRVFAAKAKPTSKSDQLYRVPTYNVFNKGDVCPGSHKFPKDVEQIPESFFQSRFSMTGDSRNRSEKHSNNLLELWEELDGQTQYPMDDLVPHGKVESLLKG